MIFFYMDKCYIECLESIDQIPCFLIVFLQFEFLDSIINSDVTYQNFRIF